jgi:plastocyanin
MIGGMLVSGAVVLAACGGAGAYGAGSSAGNGMAGMDMAAPAVGTPASDPAPVATDAVHIENFAFSPQTISVRVGSTVVWTNDDSVDHQIEFDGGAISSNVLNQHDTFSHAFPSPGTYRYICSIHPFMHGTVIVTA